jgi:hypothetical protein
MEINIKIADPVPIPDKRGQGCNFKLVMVLRGTMMCHLVLNANRAVRVFF